MTKLFVCALLAAACFSLSLIGSRDEVLLLPKQSNRITPFSIKQDDSSSQKKLKLSIECSDGSDRTFIFASGSPNICPKTDKTGTADELNSILQTIVVSSTDGSLDRAKITYKLIDAEEASQDVLTTFTQTFKQATSIPIRLLSPAIKASADSSSTELQYLVVSVDNEYFINAVSDSLSAKIENKPSWLDTVFRGPDLYITLKPAKNLSSDLSLTLRIVDKTTGLESESHIIKIEFLESVKTATSKVDSQLYFLIFLGIFTLVIIIFIFVLYFANKRIATHENLKQSIDGQKRAANHNTQTTNQSFDGKSNVLSDSIVNWNKKLIARHQQKASMVLDVSKSREQESINVADRHNTYQQFDDSDRAEEHSRDQQADGFQDISEIHQDNTSVKSQDPHQRSSFLEDFKL
jgi:hypothetical protein